MSRSLFAKPLALLLMTALFVTFSGSKRVWAQSDNFENQDNYDSLFSGQDDAGNSFEQLERETDQERPARTQKFSDYAKKRAQEKRRLADKAAEKALREQMKREDEADRQFRIKAWERDLREEANEKADPLKNFQDTRKRILEKMTEAAQQGNGDMIKTLVEASEGLKNAEYQHTHGRNPTLLDELKDLFQSPAPTQPARPVVQLSSTPPAPPRTFRKVPVKELVRRQQETWVLIADDAYGNNIPRADQIAEFTNIVLTNPGYYGPEVFIQPYPIRSLTPDDGGIRISDGDLNDTGKTNALLKAAIARHNQNRTTRTLPLLVSAEAPQAAPTVVNYSSAEVEATEPVVYAAPSASVVTSQPHPEVRAESSVGVVTSRRPRRAIRTAVTVVPRRRVVEAPAVTVVRARPIVRARPVVVRTRPVIRAARTVVAPRRAVRRAVRRSTRRGRLR